MIAFNVCLLDHTRPAICSEHRGRPLRVVSVREAASGKLTFGRAVRGGRRPMPEPAAEPERSALRQPSPESQSARVECAGCVIEFTPAGGDQIEGHAVRVEARNPALVA